MNLCSEPFLQSLRSKRKRRSKVPVNVEGLAETRRALKKFAPDLYKEMNKEIRAALQVVVKDARTQVPNSISGLSNWDETVRKSRTGRDRAFPAYSPTVIRRGLTYSVAGGKTSPSGFKAFYQLLNKSAAGAIVETAGSVSGYKTSVRSQSNNPQAGAHFNLSVNNSIGALKKAGNRTGRLLVAAYDRDQGKTLDAVFKSIDKATKAFKKRTDAIGRAA